MKSNFYQYIIQAFTKDYFDTIYEDISRGDTSEALEYIQKIDLNDIDKIHPRTNKFLLQYAFEKNNLVVFEALIDKGANINQIIPNSFGQTLLHQTAQLDINKLEILLESGADVNAQDQSGSTALMIAAEISNCDAVRLLIDYGANVGIKESNGNTALIIAVLRYNFESVQDLLDAGADINAQDTAGIRALMIAALQNQDDMFDFLIGKGVDIEQVNENGEDVLDIILKINSEGSTEFKRKIELIFEKVAEQFVSNQNYRIYTKFLDKIQDYPELVDLLSDKITNSFPREMIRYDDILQGMIQKGNFDILEFIEAKIENELKFLVSELSFELGIVDSPIPPHLLEEFKNPRDVVVEKDNTYWNFYESIQGKEQDFLADLLQNRFDDVKEVIKNNHDLYNALIDFSKKYIVADNLQLALDNFSASIEIAKEHELECIISELAYPLGMVDSPIPPYLLEEFKNQFAVVVEEDNAYWNFYESIQGKEQDFLADLLQNRFDDVKEVIKNNHDLYNALVNFSKKYIATDNFQLALDDFFNFYNEVLENNFIESISVEYSSEIELTISGNTEEYFDDAS